MRRLLGLLAAMLLCTGCGVLPGEERCFALVLSMDVNNGLFSACARVPSYQEAGSYLTLSGEGDTLQAALASLDGGAPMRLDYSQLRLITFGETLARSGHLTPALTLLLSRADFRCEAALCVTQAPPRAVCDAMAPPTGTRLSKSLDALLEARRALGLIPDVTAGDAGRLGTRACAVAAALALPEGGGTPQLEGAWLLNAEGRATSRLSGPETQLLSLLSGTFRKGVLTLPEGPVTLTNAAVRLTYEDGWATVRLRLRHGATALTPEGAQAAVTGAVFRLSRTLSEAGCDALGLARFAIRQCPDEAAWAEVDWPARYPDIPWRVSVTVAGP